MKEVSFLIDGAERHMRFDNGTLRLVRNEKGADEVVGYSDIDAVIDMVYCGLERYRAKHGGDKVDKTTITAWVDDMSPKELRPIMDAFSKAYTIEGDSTQDPDKKK